MATSGKDIYTQTKSTNILWYNHPAQYFEESLVLGNGKMGASVFGGVKSDKIFLNDATLWSGGPVDVYMNPEAHKYIPKIREALKREDYKTADSLQRNVQGSFLQSYAPLGTMFIDVKHDGVPSNLQGIWNPLFVHPGVVIARSILMRRKTIGLPRMPTFQKCTHRY